MITKEALEEKYNISEELLQSSEMTWDDLCEIYEDFSNNKFDKYKEIMEEFLSTYLKDVNEKHNIEENKQVRIHSIRSRVKDAEHLIVKIIRKKQENRLKYGKLNKDNYERFVTDLIGIRCLVLFKDDWENLHYYILSQFDNNVDYYIKDSISDFDPDEKHYYIAEKPKVHIRNGDSREGYEKVLSPDCVIDNKVYRSIHYIIKYKGVYLEIQVRTLFEEGWGEVDHAIVYPYYQNDAVLKEYTELLNRLSGLADEMSGFFHRLKELEIQQLKNGKQVLNAADKNRITNGGQESITQEEKNSIGEKKYADTPHGCLQSVIDEYDGGEQ